MERRLESIIDGYFEYLQDVESPDIFIWWAGVALVASCMQRKLWMNWGHDSIYPNMYIVLVAPSGKARKGSAINPARSLMLEAGVTLSADATSPEKFLSRMAKGAKGQQIGDTTYIHASTTICAPEFAVFLKPGDDSMVRRLTDWFDCREGDWEYDTHARDLEAAKGIWVNILAGTTPQQLTSAKFQDVLDTGLASRIVFISQTRRRKVSPAPFFPNSERGRELRAKLIHDLKCVMNMGGQYKLHESFTRAYVAWYVKNPEDSKIKSPYFDGYWSRRSMHLRKLAMILAAAKRNEPVLYEEDFEQAVEKLREAEYFMPGALSSYGRLENADVMDRIIRQLSISGEMTYAQLLEIFVREVTIDDLDLILKTLCEIGFCDIGSTKKGRLIKVKEGAKK